MPNGFASRVVVTAAHAGGIVAGIRALTCIRGDWQWLFPAGQREAFSVVAAVAVCACAAALVADLRRPAPALAPLLRRLFVLAVAAAAGQWLFARRFHPVLAWLAAATVLGTLAVARLAAPRIRAAAGLARLERLAFQCALTLVLFELGLRALGSVSRHPVFGLLDDEERATLERFAMAPGQVHLGFPCNELGHYDEPFTPGTGAGDVVVAIGDSFAVGVVPHARHYTTVCEGLLPGVRVHNLGVSAIGPAGYHHLLVEQGLPLRPDAVVVALFLGNDVGNAARWRERTSWLASVFDRRSIRAIQVPLRLWRMRGQRGSLLQAAGPAGADVPFATDAEMRAALPWVDDPMLEQPTFTEEAFLAMEVERALVLQHADRRGLWDKTFAAIAAMREACGAVPFGVLLIPDEFQVEDALWAEVVARAELVMERDAPQRRAAAWLDAAGIPFVDLLPDLRAMPPLGDGRRHVYHLRDAHFNARGNAVAGRGLARLVAALLGR
ncbi:MAG TPA: hypothetical protein VK081_03925 [Planctomycetota bacterium]|nr:hypothetical protein [Planctomycetota bacterium]